MSRQDQSNEKIEDIEERMIQSLEQIKDNIEFCFGTGLETILEDYKPREDGRTNN